MEDDRHHDRDQDCRSGQDARPEVLPEDGSKKQAGRGWVKQRQFLRRQQQPGRFHYSPAEDASSPADCFAGCSEANETQVASGELDVAKIEQEDCRILPQETSHLYLARSYHNAASRAKTAVSILLSHRLRSLLLYVFSYTHRSDSFIFIRFSTSLPYFSSTSSENLSTISPTGVVEFETISGTDSFHDMDFSGDDDGVVNPESGNCVDDFVVGDPLEWLMDNVHDGQDENNCIVHFLPESSLQEPPTFPDIGGGSGSASAPLSSGSSPSGAPEILLQPSHEPAPAAVAPLTDVMDNLPQLADPKVTVQSLFMDGE